MTAPKLLPVALIMIILVMSALPAPVFAETVHFKPLDTSEATTILESLKSADHSLDNMALSYHEVTKAKTLGPNSLTLLDTNTESDSTGRYAIQGNGVLSNGRKVYLPLEIFDGQLNLTSYGDDDDLQITIVPTMANQVRSQVSDIAPGSCFALGRGLSRLTLVKFYAANPKPLIGGIMPGGDLIYATLDPQHGYVASKIWMCGEDKKLTGEWDYKRPTKLKDGTWIESNATFKTLHSKFAVSHTITLIISKSRPSVSSDFTFDLNRPGLRIYDQRFGRPMSSDELIKDLHGASLTFASLFAIEYQEEQKSSIPTPPIQVFGKQVKQESGPIIFALIAASVAVIFIAKMSQKSSVFK